MTIILISVGMVSLALYFIMLYFAPKAVASNNLGIFSDFTDILASFILTIMIIPPFFFAIYMEITRFILGYSFLVVLLIAFHLHFAYKYNGGSIRKMFSAFFVRFFILSCDCLFFGINLIILNVYTVSMGLSLKILWGFSLLSIALLITVLSVHNTASNRRFSNPITFVKNFNAKE